MNKKVILTSIIVLVLDLFSKYIISITLKLGEVKRILGNLFYITNLHNVGAAFSIMENMVPLLILVSIIALVIIYFIEKDYKSSTLTNIAFGMLYGGIVGNLIDRILFGYVRDFIGVGTFPVFNIADSSIVIGIALLIIETVGENYGDKSKRRKD